MLTYRRGRLKRFIEGGTKSQYEHPSYGKTILPDSSQHQNRRRHVYALENLFMTFHIRSGQQPDVVACVDLLRAWAEETPWMAELDELQPMQVFWSDLFETDLVWVAEMGGCIVGFCTRDDENIGALYVAADARDIGIGKGLLDKAKAGRDWITVWAYEKNKSALKFYQREGLIEVSREIEDDQTS